MARHFKGTGVAVVTPFKNGAIDYDALTNVIEHVIEGGVDYIVSLGSTGEAITCDAKECRTILDHTIRQIDGRVPLVAGPFGNNSTWTHVKKIRSYNFDGIDAITGKFRKVLQPKGMSVIHVVRNQWIVLIEVRQTVEL